jgi:transcriptional regulator with XRE-family HTH domain
MISPDQIRAARALLNLEQQELAKRAQVSVATVRRVETVNGNTRVSPRAVASIQHALEAAGAEFIPGGVRRKRQRSAREVEERICKIMAIAHESAKLAAENLGFREDDLYDEFGLPA